MVDEGLDRASNTDSNERTVTALQNLNATFGNSDVFRHKHPLQRAYTWKGHNTWARLDRCYAQNEILHQIEKFSTETTSVMSDHC
jgi:endonuclease/exonuclease/phosphatase family metal-dependent hydrolase